MIRKRLNSECEICTPNRPLIITKFPHIPYRKGWAHHHRTKQEQSLHNLRLSPLIGAQPAHRITTLTGQWMERAKFDSQSYDKCTARATNYARFIFRIWPPVITIDPRITRSTFLSGRIDGRTFSLKIGPIWETVVGFCACDAFVWAMKKFGGDVCFCSIKVLFVRRGGFFMYTFFCEWEIVSIGLYRWSWVGCD